jgi:hypothetical protein
MRRVERKDGWVEQIRRWGWNRKYTSKECIFLREKYEGLGKKFRWYFKISSKNKNISESNIVRYGLVSNRC